MSLALMGCWQGIKRHQTGLFFFHKKSLEFVELTIQVDICLYKNLFNTFEKNFLEKNYQKF